MGIPVVSFVREESYIGTIHLLQPSCRLLMWEQKSGNYRVISLDIIWNFYSGGNSQAQKNIK